MSQLNVEVREGSGKGVARKLRAAGRAPGVLYGQGKDPVSISFEPRVLERLLRAEGHNTLFDLEGGAISGRRVLVKELQRHPVRGEITHADLFEINVNQTITVSVPIHLEGISIGVSRDGGLLDHTLRELEVDCLPNAIPESIDIDVSALELGETIHVSDVQAPAGVTFKTADELGIVGIVAPNRAEEEVVAAPVEGAEGAEVAAADGEKAEGGSDS